MCCPNCNANNFVRNGINQTGKQKYKCNECGYQFVFNPEKFPISDETKETINLLLLERVPLAGIVRVTGVSARWLQYYVNDIYDNVPRKIIITPKTTLHLTIECDELWSFVGKHSEKQWVWLAKDRESRQIIGVYVGERSAVGAKGLWDSLPEAYRESAIAYTDFWEAYACIFPSERHVAVGKETGLTNNIERFNATLRARVSRLVRKSYSFSKKLANHIGAIWYFIHHYNESLLDEYAT